MSAFLNIFGLLLTGFLLLASPTNTYLADIQQDCNSNKQVISCCNDGQCHMMWTKHNAPDSPRQPHQCCCKHTLSFKAEAVLNLSGKTGFASHTGSGNAIFQNQKNFLLHHNLNFCNKHYFSHKSKNTYKTEQSFLCVFRV